MTIGQKTTSVLKALFVGKSSHANWPTTGETEIEWALDIACALNSTHLDKELLAPRIKGSTQWVILESVVPDLKMSVKKVGLKDTKTQPKAQQTLCFLNKSKIAALVQDSGQIGPTEIAPDESGSSLTNPANPSNPSNSSNAATVAPTELNPGLALLKGLCIPGPQTASLADLDTRTGSVLAEAEKEPGRANTSGPTVSATLDTSVPSSTFATSASIDKYSEPAATGTVPEAVTDLTERTLPDSEFIPCMLLQAAQGQVLLLAKGSNTPIQLTWGQFSQLVGPYFYRLSKVYGKDEEAPVEFGYAWLGREMWRYKPVWRDVLIASVFIQLISLLTPLMTQAIIDKVITNRTQSTLQVIIIGLLVFNVFSTALGWVRQYLVLHTGNKVDAVMGSKVFAHLLRLPMPYFETRPTGTLVTRLHGVETIRDFITGTFVTVLLDIPSMLIFFVIMVYYSPILSAIAIGVALLMALISFFVAPVLRDKTNEQYMAGATVQSFSTEYISGMETVKSLQMEGQVQAQYSQYMGDYMQKGFEAKQVSNTYNTAMNFLDQVSTLAILGVGAWLAMTESSFTIGMLVAFQMFAGKVTQPLLRLSGLWQQFQQANIALKRLGDVMNVPTEKYGYIPTSVRTQAPALEVKDLGFSYSQDTRPLYENLSFKIEAGQCVAVVGPSGCGKSTIAKLLQGFYPSYKGQIIVGGRELRSIAVNELRTWFGVVPQETILFSGTISDNLQAARSNATLEDMVKVCKLAGVHDAIEKLPNGYLTEIGERGVGLSGGQKQRLAIARALIKGARVLIFDESTANLDKDSAQAVAETVNVLRGQLTLVFVAHHMPDNLEVDRIIRLPDGVDVEQSGSVRTLSSKRAQANRPLSTEPNSAVNKTSSDKGASSFGPISAPSPGFGTGVPPTAVTPTTVTPNANADTNTSVTATVPQQGNPTSASLAPVPGISTVLIPKPSVPFIRAGAPGVTGAVSDAIPGDSAVGAPGAIPTSIPFSGSGGPVDSASKTGPQSENHQRGKLT